MAADPSSSSMASTAEAALAGRLFLGLLGSTPDRAALDSAARALGQGVAPADLAAAIAASPQAAARAAALSDTGFLLAAHRDLFDRPPAPGELQYWMDRLAEGDSRAMVVADLADPTAPLLGRHAPAETLHAVTLGPIAPAPAVSAGSPLAVHGLWDAPAPDGPLPALVQGGGHGGVIALHIQGPDGQAAAGWTGLPPDLPGPAPAGEGPLVLEALLGLLPGSLAALDATSLQDLAMASLIHLDPGQAVSFDWHHDAAATLLAHEVPPDLVLHGPAPAIPALTVPEATDWAGTTIPAAIHVEEVALPGMAGLAHELHLETPPLG